MHFQVRMDIDFRIIVLTFYNNSRTNFFLLHSMKLQFNARMKKMAINLGFVFLEDCVLKI